MSSDRCVHCDSPDITTKRVTRSFGKGERLMVIEGIPLVSCGNCGQSYFTAATMHEIERVKAHRKSMGVRRPVPVAPFAVP